MLIFKHVHVYCELVEIVAENVYLYSISRLYLTLVLSSDYPRVVAALLQLHDNVDESSDAALHSLAKSLVVLCQYPPRKE